MWIRRRRRQDDVVNVHRVTTARNAVPHFVARINIASSDFLSQRCIPGAIISAIRRNPRRRALFSLSHQHIAGAHHPAYHGP